MCGIPRALFVEALLGRHSRQESALFQFMDVQVYSRNPEGPWDTAPFLFMRRVQIRTNRSARDIQSQLRSPSWMLWQTQFLQARESIRRAKIPKPQGQANKLLSAWKPDHKSTLEVFLAAVWEKSASLLRRSNVARAIWQVCRRGDFQQKTATEARFLHWAKLSFLRVSLRSLI